MARDSDLSPLIEEAGRNMRSASSALREARAEGARVVRLARAAGWSEYAITKVMGVSRTTVRKWMAQD